MTTLSPLDGTRKLIGVGAFVLFHGVKLVYRFGAEMKRTASQSCEVAPVRLAIAFAITLSAAACGAEPTVSRRLEQAIASAPPREQAPMSCSSATLGPGAAATSSANAGPPTPPRKGVPGERAVLVEFYQSTRGANWVKQDNWLSESVDHCQWHGVECDDAGYVAQLTLYDNDLDGPLPESLCRLEHLHTLYFSFNRIRGELPKNLGQCKSLKNLWLKANNLTGKIPDGICASGTLEYIDLHVNSLSGPIPESIGKCSALQVLRLDRNKLTGGVPKALFSLPKLSEIYLHHNKLSGALDPDIAKVHELQYLFLGDNEFTGPIPPLTGLTELVTLRLENNRFSGAVPPSLGELPKLQVLRLDHNRLDGDVPPALAQTTAKLGECGLSGNKLTCPACNPRCGLQGRQK